jgi:hypothetical protein
MDDYGRCVDPYDCPCFYEGKEYPKGVIVKDDGCHYW